MKLKKRVFSILMMLCMIVTLMPASYSATETGTETESGTLIWNYNISFEDGTIANDADATIWLTDDISLGGIVVSEYVGGTGTYEFNYVGDKYVYNDIEYTYAYITYNMPSGYVFRDEKGNSGEDISGLGLVYTVTNMKSLVNGTESFVAVSSDNVGSDEEDNTQTQNTKDLYIKFVNSVTKEVYTQAELFQSYFYNPNTNSTVDVTINEVETGLYKVSVDGDTYSGYNYCGLFFLGEGHKFVESESVTMQGIKVAVDQWFSSGETIIAEVDSSGASTITKTCGFLKDDLSVLEGVNFTIYLSNGETDTQKVQIANFTGGKGTFKVQCLNDSFYYNGQTYSTLECSYVLPDGYVTSWPLSSEGTHYYTYSEDFINVSMDGMMVQEKPEVNTEILVKFMHGSAALNTPCKNTEAQAVDLGSQQYTITVDEEDITVDANGTLYLTTSLNEMFPNGLPEAPDHEVAGKFLGWWKAYNGNTIEDYCYQPDDEVNLQINTADNSVSFTAVYDRIISPYKISYIDEMGNEISNQFYMTYVDFPKTFGEKLEQTLDVVETFGLKHVGSFGEISTKVTATYPEEMYPTLLALGSIVDVTYTYEYNRTDTTFEKTEYTFGLEDGTIVNGVKVKVSLCNGMNDADKVTIETSTSGQGDFVIEHIDDVIYYGGNTYDTIEFEYDFPEGYVIKDSDITGTTVWYTATDWCEGGGAFWLLEKLPEVPAEPEVEIIIPEEDAPAEEEVKVEVPVEKPVVSEEIMDDIIEANKKHPVKIETNDDVTIEFPAGGMKPVEGKHDYDFGVKIEKDYDKAHDKYNHGGQHVDEHRKFKEDEFVLRINYNYSGELPGEAEISIPVGKEWAGKRLYYYQLMEDGSYRYTGQHAVVDEHGYFRVKQGHCSDYVIVTAAPTSELLYYLYSTDAANAASYTSPKTGDNNMFVYLMTIAATGVVVTTAMRRKVK